MATNRLIVKEQIATYTSLLFEAVKNEGGSEGVLRLSNEAKQIVAAIRGNADLDAALKDPGFTPEQKANRQLLREGMLAAGFDDYVEEWWHYAFISDEEKVYYDFPIE